MGERGLRASRRLPVKMREESISPAQARKFLETNSINRLIRDSWVADLAARMRRGEWVLSPDPICVGTDGQLYNGQHRLWAVVYSETTQRFFFCRDCDPVVLRIIDSGNPRTVTDLVNIVLSTSGKEKLSTNVVAAVRAFYELPTRFQGTWAPDRLIRAKDKAAEHVFFAMGNLPYSKTARRLVNTASYGAVARAHANGVPEHLLAGFCKVYLHGDPSDVRDAKVDSYVRRLRERITTSETWYTGTIAFRAMVYLTVTKAIRLFNEGKAESKIVLNTEDPYPLPARYKSVIEGVIVKPAKESFRKAQEELSLAKA